MKNVLKFLKSGVEENAKIIIKEFYNFSQSNNEEYFYVFGRFN